MTQRHVIEILYTERCRFLPQAVERVRHALSLRTDDVDVEVRLVLVETFLDAVSRKFRGSPTVRIDGRDVVGAAGGLAPIGLFARGRVVHSRTERAPTLTAIRRLLDEVVSQERERVALVRASRTRAVAAEVSA